MKILVLLAAVLTVTGQEPPRNTYVLGPGDQVQVRVLDAEEVGPGPYTVDMRGNLNVPMAGRVKASGLTPEELEKALTARLAKYLKEPQVVVMVAEMRSQPVTVMGAVMTPGVRQVQGAKSLYELLSLAGGLRQDAGYSIRITRKKQWGKIPLPEAKEDASGQFWVAEVGAKEVLDATAPEKNIAIMPEDVISVPKGEVVYVIGAVKKPGGYVLGEREKVTALQALAMAEGLDGFAKGGSAKILRKKGKTDDREEIVVNLAKILKNEMKDVALATDDILFVPTNAAKRAVVKTAEAGLAIGTGLAIYRR